MVPRLSKSSPSSSLSLLPTYLCLHCSHIATYDERDSHDKEHTFSVESNRGYIWCRECDDFIYDPTLEEVRSGQGKKRKYAAYISDVDSKITASNATAAPCRARGLRGLYNMGQTCFMSVVLQSLIHNPFIRTFYLSGGHRSTDCEREACTSCALDDIFTEFHSTEKAEGYGAVAMLQGSWKGGGSLAGYQQQDAHEYLQFILNNLHTANLDEDATKEEKAEECPCVIHQTFCGIMRSTVACSKCKNVTSAFDPFIDLSLDVKSNTPHSKKSAAAPLKKNGAGGAQQQTIDLSECLDRFTSPEQLAATDYTCRECNAPQTATKRLSLSRLPAVLPIHLKRFSHSKTLATSVKLDTRVHFPTTLDLAPYSSRTRPKKAVAAQESAANGSKAAGEVDGGEGEEAVAPVPSRPVYELSSVIVHKGKMDNGHYVSYAREGDEWFLFDDSKVVLVEEREVLGAEAYMLFYVIREID